MWYWQDSQRQGKEVLEVSQLDNEQYRLTEMEKSGEKKQLLRILIASDRNAIWTSRDKNGDFIGSWNQTAEKAECDTESQKHLAAGTRSLSRAQLHLCFSHLGSGHSGSWNTSASISQAHILPTLTPGMTIPIENPLEHSDGSVGSRAYFSWREEAEHSA